MEKSYSCRYCYEDFNDRNKVLCPCDCDGDLKYICKNCLLSDITTHQGDRNFKCPTCKTLYKKEGLNHFEIEHSIRGLLIARCCVFVFIFLNIYFLCSLDTFNFAIYILLVIIFLALTVINANTPYILLAYLVVVFALDLDNVKTFISHCLVSIMAFLYCLLSINQANKDINIERVKCTSEKEKNNGISVYDKETFTFTKLK